MKLFISTISLLIFLWSPIIESPKIKKNRIFQLTNTELNTNKYDDFNGLWVNEDELTKAITKCKISYKNNSFIVQMWGACYPQDCDWGENIANDVQKGTNKFQLLWDQEFAESLVNYEIIEGKLKVTNKRHYKDNSGRSDNTSVEYFQKE